MRVRMLAEREGCFGRRRRLLRERWGRLALERWAREPL
jgi:hypothetical protein